MTRPQGYMETKEIPLDQLISDGEWEADPGLTQSVAQVGQIDEAVVYPVADGKYMIAAGRGRHAAARELEWESLRCDVYKTELHAIAAIALAENVRRANPLADARNLEAAACTLEDLDIKMASGLNATEIKTRLQLLNLTEELQTLLEQGKLRIGAAKRLARLSKRDQRAAWKLACAKAQEAERPREVPTVGQVQLAVREVKGRKAPQMALELPKGIEVQTGPDPLALAQGIKTVIANGEAVDLDEHETDALEKAVEVLERIG